VSELPHEKSVLTPLGELAAAGFTSPGAYDAGRPGYCAPSVEFLVQGLNITAQSRVLDLGAGTGKFTVELAQRAETVFAVEPSQPMRDTLLKLLPGVIVLDGTGESLPLESASLDAVVVAQAFHWFDPQRSLLEIERVLTPRGRLGLVWNERDESVAWVHELSVAMQWTTRQPYRVGTDFSEIVASHSHFDDIVRRRFHFSDLMDHDRLRQRVLSTSYLAAASDDERKSIMEHVDVVIEKLPAQVSMPYIADAYVCSRSTTSQRARP
jgi:SAM-dependent methyltransferase